MEGNVLIIGGGKAQLKLIQNAKSLGLKTIVTGIAGDYPGYKFADKTYSIDINNKEDIAQIAVAEKIDGVCLCCSDYGLNTVGYICDKLNLNGLSEKAASFATNKLDMKKALVDNGLPTARYAIIRNERDISVALTSLKFPLIVKAVDLQGSKGIFVSENETELYENVKRAISLSKKDYCLIEEYLIGEEFGAQAFIQDGKILFVHSHGDMLLKKNDISVPIGHYMPYFKSDSDNQQLKRIITDAATALELDNCAINVDLINVNGTFYIIELTGRAGANQLPEIINEYFGINYYEFILKNALGVDLQSEFAKTNIKSRFVMSRQLFSLQSGTVTDINLYDIPDYISIELYIKRGTEIQEFTNSQDCIGQLICTGKDYDDCISKITKFLNDNIIISIGDNKKLRLK